jgi:hypothetical protein
MADEILKTYPDDATGARRPGGVLPGIEMVPVDESKFPGEANPSVENLKDTVVGILAIPDDNLFATAVTEFTQDRIDVLSATSTVSSVSVLTPPAHGFLRPDTEIVPIAVGNSFRMDDSDIYTHLFDRMRHMYQMPGWRKKADQQYRQFLLMAIQDGQAAYFGATEQGALTVRDGIHAGAGVSFDEEGGEDVRHSIREFKGMAFCAERAATTQNMFALLGFDTTLMIGEQKQGENRPGLHAWNVVRNSRNTPVLYDPTQPHGIVDQDGILVGVRPKVAPADELMQGRELVVMHKTYVQHDGSVVLLREVPCVYEPPISLGVEYLD